MAAPDDPIRQHVFERLRPPGSLAHVLGTDHFGRDLLSRLMYGARISLLVGVFSVGIAAGIGGAIGILAGYFGGALDQALMAVVEVLMAFPLILLAIAIVAVLGAGVINLMLAVGISNVPAFVRLTRGEVIRHRSREYVEAARALGAGHAQLILRHVLRNCWSPIIVGNDHRGRHQVPPARPVDLAGPRPRDYRHGPRVQPSRRRDSRRARPAAAGGVCGRGKRVTRRFILMFGGRS